MLVKGYAGSAASGCRQRRQRRQQRRRYFNCNGKGTYMRVCERIESLDHHYYRIFYPFFSPPFFTLLFIIYNTLSQSGIGFANRGEPMAVNVGHLASARTLPVLVWLQLWRLLHCFYYPQQITRQRNADVCNVVTLLFLNNNSLPTYPLLATMLSTPKACHAVLPATPAVLQPCSLPRMPGSERFVSNVYLHFHPLL